MIVMPILTAAVIAAAPPAASPAPPPSPPTSQAMFDAASAAVDGGRCGEAVRQFEAFEARGAGRSPAVAAIVALRKGRCLVALGRRDEAEVLLTTGLATVGAAPVYVGDRVLALVARGQIALYRFDYPTAARDFAAARALAAPDERLEPLLWLVRATMFDAGTDARGYADEALALATAPGVKPRLAAEVRTLHARVLLNHGDVKAGYAELKKALNEQGGLTDKVDAAMIGTRGDLALAALLNRDADNAREYLAYTGAGHGTPFGHAAVMAPPPCDGETLKPDDSAIVEFGIAEDGSVAYAVPIYASRLGTGAVAFAEAVAGWSWKPDSLKNIAPLFRAFTRVELRCSTASAQPPVLATLRRDLHDWLRPHGAVVADAAASDAARVPLLRAELARRRAAAGDGIAIIPVLVALGRNDVLTPADRRAALDEALALAIRNAAPVPVTTLLAAEALDQFVWKPKALAAHREALRQLLATPAVAADPRSRSVVRILIAQEFYRSPAPADAADLLRAVADDAALAEHDSLRSNARLRLASLLAATGNLADARTAFAASGVDAAQCALVDARPVLQSAGVSSADFPREVMRWGFDGWVKLEFDVAADGHLTDRRAIIAYPPQVFGDAAIAATRNWRYRPTFRPDGIAGCTGAQQQIRFHIG